MAHRTSQSTSRASLEAAYADVSMASVVAPSEAGSESLSEASGTALGPNKNAVAYLVYHNRGDPRVAGYKQPTTRDIPQVKLPRVESVDALEVDAYLSQLQAFERHASPAPDADPALPRLDSVPAVFFDSDFELDNPRVFDAVMGEDSSILQEKLSWYVDVVEAHLEKEIAAASSQFFSVTASFHDIEVQAAVLAQQIASFKSVISNIQSGVVAHYNETARLKNKLHDLDCLINALDQLQRFLRAVESLPSQDPAAVLDHAATARSIATQGIDLSRVTVTRSLFDKLTVTEDQARADAVAKLVDALLTDLRSEESTVVDIEAAMAVADRAGMKTRALEEYVQAVDLEIEAIVKGQLPGSVGDTSPELSSKLRRLSARDIETMFQTLFAALLKAFIKLQDQPIPTSVTEGAVTNAVGRLARVLYARKDSATVLSVGYFARFFTDVTDFCRACESITKSPPTELSESLVAQTKFYIHTLHNWSSDDLNTAMDADVWRPAAILPQTQVAAGIISSAGSVDPSQWSLKSSSAANDNGTQRILLDGQPYTVSKSTQTLVGSVVKYLQLICILPAVYVPAIATALQELLVLFNKKAYSLILGFGAKTTAGLKQIFIRNMLVTAESLRLVYNTIGPLKRCTERHLPSSALSILNSFDSIQQNYFDHRTEIQSKVIKLMSDKVRKYAFNILHVDWSVRQPQANEYMRNLMNDTMRACRVALELLPPQLAQDLVASIFDAYKPVLLDAYGAIHVDNSDEKENVLRDLRYFKTKVAVFSGQAAAVAELIYESAKMIVGPDLPEREPDLETSPEKASPRTSTESSIAMDSRQAFATAVAQGNAQAEFINESARNVKNAHSNGLNNGSKLSNQQGGSKSEQESPSNGDADDKNNSKGGHQNRSDEPEKQAEPQLMADVDASQPASKATGAGSDVRENEKTDAKRLAEEAQAKTSAEEAAEARKLTEEAEAKRLAEDTEAKRLAEAKKSAEEAEAKRRAEEAEAKRLAEAEAKRSAEEAEAKLAEEAEAKEAEAKKLAEEAEAKRLAEEAENKKLAEEVEAKRLAEEAEAKRLAEEAEAKRLAEEAEAKRLAEEAEAKRLAEKAEAKRLAEEAEEKRLAEEAEAKKLAEEAEAKKLAEEAEAKKLAEEAKAKRLAEEAEAKRLAEDAEAKKREREPEAEVAEEAELKLAPHKTDEIPETEKSEERIGSKSDSDAKVEPQNRDVDNESREHPSKEKPQPTSNDSTHQPLDNSEAINTSENAEVTTKATVANHAGSSSSLNKKKKKKNNKKKKQK